MDLPTRSIRENRSSADSVGRWVTLVGVAITLTISDSKTRDVTGGRGNRIRSNPGEDAVLEGRGAGRGVLGNCDLREVSEGEGEADGRLHVGDDAGREDDAGVGCH